MAERPKAAVLKTVFGFPSRLTDYICLGARRSSTSGIGVRRCANCAAKIGCWKAAHQPAPKKVTALLETMRPMTMGMAASPTSPDWRGAHPPVARRAVSGIGCSSAIRLVERHRERRREHGARR